MKLSSLSIIFASLVFLTNSAPSTAQQSPFAAKPAENPFAAAQADRFAGNFVSEDVNLTLEKTGTGYAGELFYAATDQTYPVTAEIVEDRIEGHFSTGGGQFAYSFTLGPDGQSGVFDTEGFRGTLRLNETVLTGMTIDGRAGELLNEAIAIKNTLPAEDADAITSAIALALAQGGEFDRASEFIETLPQGDPNREWSIKAVKQEIAISKALTGDHAGVNALIEEISLEGFARETAVKEFAAIYVDAGNLEPVRGLIDTIPAHHDRRPDIAKALIEILADEGDIAGATSLLSYLDPAGIMGKHNFKLATYDIATAEIRSGNEQAAMSAIERLPGQIETDPDFAKILTPATIGNGVIHALKKLYAEGNFAQVLALSDEFDRRIKAYPKYIRKIEASNMIEGYGAIASAQLATGDKAGAKKTLKKAQKLLKGVDKQLKGFAQRPIAQVQALMGDTDDTLKLIGRSDGVVTRMIAYADLAQAQAKIGDLSAASYTLMVAHSDLVKSKNPPQGGNVNWVGLLKSAVSIGKFVQGGNLSFGSAAKLGNSLIKNNQPVASPNAGPNAEHARKVASAYTHYAYTLGSLDNLPDHETLIMTNPEAEVRSMIRYQMATRQLAAGDLEAAQISVAKVTDANMKAHFLISLAKAMAAKGDVDGALDFTKTANSPAAKAVMLSQIAGAVLKQS